MTDDSQQEKQLISCRVCGATDRLLRCSKCKVAFYCSQTHQQSDWRAHRIECRKYTTNNNSSSHTNATSVRTTTDSSSVKRSQHQENYQQHHQRKQHPQKTSWSDNSKNLASNIGVELPTEGSSEAEILHVNAEVLSTRRQFDHLKTYNKNLQNTTSTTTAATTTPTTNNGDTNNIDDHHHNSDQENARLYRSLADNSMPISNDNILSPNLTPSDMGHEDLCKHIINDLNTYGLSVIDDFLGKHKGLEILNEVHHMYNAGVFKNGQLVSNAIAERDLRTIRGDKITWVKGTESGCLNIGYLINQVDNVVISANKMQNNGTLGNYKIRERTKAMVACYPGSGAHYVMHVDNPNKDGRVITAIYYLNLNWDTKRSGGVLRIFPEHADTVADIEPKFDRIIFFWSDRRNPHEVQPAHRTRYAITVWYFDADERELALNKYRKYKKNDT